MRTRYSLIALASLACGGACGGEERAISGKDDPSATERVEPTVPFYRDTNLVDGGHGTPTVDASLDPASVPTGTPCNPAERFSIDRLCNTCGIQYRFCGDDG